MSFWDSDILNEVEEKKTGNFEPIPDGSYRMMLTDAEVKATKNGGHYLNAKFELAGNDQFDGRVLFAKFNVDNANSTAVSIGLGQLKEFATACSKVEWYDHLKGADDWTDAESRLNTLHQACGNIPVEAKVVIKKDEKYGDSNDIKRFKAIAGSAPVSGKATSKKDAKKAPWED